MKTNHRIAFFAVIIVSILLLLCSAASASPLLIVNTTEAKGEVGDKIEFSITCFPEYTNEKICVDVYKENSYITGYELTIYNSSTASRDETIVIDTSELGPGEYTLKWQMKFYSYNQWNNTPSTQTSKLILTQEGTEDNPIKLTSGTTKTITWTNDRDERIFASFSAPSNGFISLDLTKKTKSTLSYDFDYGRFPIKIYQGDTLVWYGKDTGTKKTRSYKVGVRKGEYTITIDILSYAYKDYPVEIDLAFSFTEDECFEIEPNNTKQDATRLNFNTMYSAVYGDEDFYTKGDYYVFNCIADRKYEFRIANLNSLREDADATVYFYDTTGKMYSTTNFDYDQSRGFNCLKYKAPATGDYYFEITGGNKEPVEFQIGVYEIIDPVEAFVIRCYKLILGRDPDPAGLADWTGQLKNGTKKASEIIDGFVNSPEYLDKHHTDAESVEILYMAMLNRGSDPAGKNYWMSALHVGNPFAVIINGFCGSQEFMALCNEYGIQPGSVKTGETIPFDPEWVAPDTTKIQAYVTRCYKVILSRDPDPSGLADWTNQLYSGKRKAAEIIDGFVNSQEFLGKNLSNEDAVEVLYNAMLDRGSDPAGKADWVGKLNEGNPYASVINGFCGSQEFMALCKEYGIEPGSVAMTTLKAASPVPQEADAEESADAPAEPAVEAEAASEPETQAPAETEVNTAEAVSVEPAAAETEPAHADPAARSKATGLKQDKVEAFVLRCYRIAFNREPGADELDRYVTMIMDGKKSVRQVVQGFIFSDEFKGRNLGNEEIIRILYRLYLDREADEEGLAHWLAALNDAGNLQSIVNSFAGSSEFNSAMQKMRR